MAAKVRTPMKLDTRHSILRWLPWTILLLQDPCNEKLLHAALDQKMQHAQHTVEFKGFALASVGKIATNFQLYSRYATSS
eukprot:1882307-Amphidinium_carterae.3